MSMTNRIFALLLTVAMLVALLCACNQTEEPLETAASTPDNTTASTETTPAETLPPDPPTTPAQEVTCVSITCGDSAICIAARGYDVARVCKLFLDALLDLTDLAKLRARDNNSVLVNNSDNAFNGILHLIDYVLKQSV